MNNVLPIDINTIFEIHSYSADRREETVLHTRQFLVLEIDSRATWQIEKKEWEKFKWQWRKIAKEKNEETGWKLHENCNCKLHVIAQWLACSKPSQQNISKSKCNFINQPNRLRQMIIQGPADRYSSVFLYFFCRACTLWLYGGALLSEALNRTLKMPCESYFQSAYASVVIIFILFLRIPAAVRSTSSYSFNY